MTARNSPRSSPHAVPMRPIRTRGTGATAAVAAGLLVLQALVGGAYADCVVGVANNYNVSLTLYSYDGFDNLCTDPYETATVQPGYNTNGGAFDRAVPLTRLGGTPKPAS
jgi:hypothetical protein